MIQLRKIFCAIIIFALTLSVQAQSTPADFRYLVCDTTQTDSLNSDKAKVNLNQSLLTESNEPATVDSDDIQPHIPTSYSIDKNCVVGDIPYTCDVSSTGAATMVIPINCHKSEGGFNPSVSLIYNSQGGAGVLGWGWSFTGASAITPCNRTLFYDGTTDGIKLGSDNAFMLDGQRLIFIKKEGSNKYYYQSQQGSIKAVLRAWSFQYVYLGGIFDVYYPDGRHAIYSIYDGYAYHITKVTDKAGNEITYEYDKQKEHYRLSDIKYGDNESVNFNYITNTDSAENSQKYVAGIKIVCDYKLNSITTKRTNIIDNTYSFKYDSLNIKNRERLLERIYCKKQNDNLNFLQLFYGELHKGGPDYTYETKHLSHYFNFSDPSSYRISVGQIDNESQNDGLLVYKNKVHYYMGENSMLYNEYTGEEDIIVYSGLDKLIVPSSLIQTGKGFIDAFCMNTDDKKGDEVVRINNYKQLGLDKVCIHVYSNKNPWEGLKEQYVREFSFTEIFGAVTNIIPKYYFQGDYNGDGKRELLIITRGERSQSRVKIVDLDNNLYLYDEISPISYYTNIPAGGDYGAESYYNSDRLFAIDYNGDGKTDLCQIDANGINIYTFNDESGKLICKKVSTDTSIKKESLRNCEILVGEFNGDGKPDFLISPPRGSIAANVWYIYLGKGNGYFSKTKKKIDRIYDKSKYFLQDINLDGRTDLIEHGTVKSNISNENNTFCNIHILRAETNPIVRKSIYDYGNIVAPATIQNIDNTSSLFFLGSRGTSTRVIYQRRNDGGDLLAGFVDSNGIVSKIKYGQMLHSPNYISSFEAPAFPYENYSGPVRICQKIQKYKQGELISDINYKYTNAVIHRQGLGFCGFNEIEYSDRITERFKKKISNPYMFGIPICDESNVEKNTYTFNVNIAPNKLTKILLTGKITENTVLNNTVTSSYTYDTYGNQLSETNNFEGNLKTTKNNQYTNVVNDSTNIIGLPTRISETSTRGGNSYTNVTEIAYNDAWFPASKKQYTNNNKLVKEEYFDYDSNHNLIQNRYKTFNSEWLNTTFAYDGRKLINQTNERGHIVSYTYNSKGNIDYITDHKGNRTTYSYDSWNRKNGATYPDGTVELTTISWAEGVPGALINVETIATGKPTEVAYLNALKQEIRTGVQRFDGSSRYVDKQYDIKGRLTQESQPFKTTPTQWCSYTYDDYDRILTTTTASGKTEIMTYSGRNTTSSTNGISTTRKYDAVGSLESIVDPGGEIIYNYRPDNQLSSIVAPGNIITSFGYDDYGRQTIINDPSAGIKQFAYDNAGNINCETDARGKTVRSTFDRFNLLTKRQYDGGLSVDYTYNDEGNLLKTVDSKNKSTSYKYDNLSRVIEEKDSIFQLRWFKKNFHYGVGSVITNIDYADKLAHIATENYKYSNGYNTEITLNDTIAVWKLTAENSRGLTSEVRTGPLYRSYGYDLDGRSTSRFIYRPDADIQGINYKYNTTTGNVEWREDGMRGKRENFGYDNLNRLTTYGNHAVEYAPNGNITRLTNVGTFTYNNTVKPYAIETATSTAAKELIALRNQHIVYNAMQHPDTITEAPYVGVFEYYGDGRRAIMKIDKSARAGGYALQRWYMGRCYEYESLLEIRKTTLQRRLYVGGDYYSAPAVYIKKGNEGWKLYYIIRDNLGSITHVTDTSGNLIQELSYDPWGSFRDPSTHIVYHTDEAPIPFLGRGFTGHEHLLQFGLINMNGRFYDPSLGRFLSPDPYVQMPDFTQNFNRYTYCLNNPLIYKDESGEFIQFLVGAGIGAVFNVTMNAIDGNIHSFGDAMTYMGVGALSGALSVINPIAGAALLGGGNSAVNQGLNNGWGNIDIEQVGASALMGAATSWLSGGIGQALAGPISRLTSGISSPILRSAVGGGLSGGASGMVLGTGTSIAEGADVSDVFKGGLNGAMTGALSGGAGGAASTAAMGLMRPPSKKIQSSPLAIELLEGGPTQRHHIASSLNQRHSPVVKDYMNKYGLKRNGEWNIIVMPVKYHNGRHTNYYNEFVIKHLKIADQQANGNQALFLNYFETNIRGAIISNPSILYYKEEINMNY